MIKLNKFIFYLSLIAIILMFGLVIFVPQLAHAQDLHTNLISPGTTGVSDWVFTIWKIMLGIANVFVVIVLLFLAVVSIAHLNYDTYQVKKSLPLLIGGIIAANFSILICRMIVDVSEVLINTFASDPNALVHNYLCGLALGSGPNFSSALASLSLIILIVLGLFILIAVLILSFLLWIRKVVIFLLVAVAPVAMILYAFPPTQGIFKQWWNQFLRWVFMGPIIMVVLWACGLIGNPGGSTTSCSGTSIGQILTIIGLSFVASIVPFKLGGAIMGAWSNLGKKLSTPATGTAKRWGRDLGTAALNSKYGRFAGNILNKNEASKSRFDAALNKAKRTSDEAGKGRYTKVKMDNSTEEDMTKKHDATWKKNINEQEGGIYTLHRAEAENAEKQLKIQEANLLNSMNEGSFDKLSDATLKRVANVNNKLELKAKYTSTDDQLGKAEAALKKRTEIDFANKGMEAMTLHQDFMAEIKGKTVANFNGEDIDYDKARTTLSSLRNEYNTLSDDDPRKTQIGQNITNLENGISSFEEKQSRINPKLNFSHYLDKNSYGRMQARVNPMLGGEVEAILKSENINQIMDSLENGGGTSEFRFTADDVKNYTTGKIDQVSIPARYGIQSYLMSMQAKVASSGGIDQLEAVSGGIRLFEKMSPGTSQQLLESLKTQMSPESIRRFETEVGKSINDVTADDILRFDISRPNSASRDVVRRLANEIHQHAALGVAGSPGSYVGKARNNIVMAQDLMAKKNPEALATKALGGAVALTGQTSEADVLRGAEPAMQQIQASGAQNVILSLQTDVVTRVIPQGITIDEATKRRIIDTISSFQGDDINQLSTQLAQINSQLKINFDVNQLPDIKLTATKVKNGLDNIDELGRLAVVETCLPHYSGQVKALPDIASVEEKQNQVLDLANRMKQNVDSGHPFSADSDLVSLFDRTLQSFGHTRMDRERMMQNIDANPKQAIELIRKKGLVLEAARRIKQLWQEQQPEIIERAKSEGKEDRAIVEILNRRNIENDPKVVDEMIKKVVLENFSAQSQNPPQTPPSPPPPQTPPGGTPPSSTPSSTPTPPAPPQEPTSIPFEPKPGENLPE